ncbi:MAG: Holliday junction branch migration protein RuvA [Oligoflexia bacterium]|nr:Holliday junction branch migration protein RuvA [Oligoflexia bacterium]
MISKLTGRVDEIDGLTATIDVAGVGYEVLCSRACSDSLTLGSNAAIVVYTDVKQDSIRLFGFCDRLERQVFLLLLSVQGIGPRTALDIVSAIDKVELLRVIAAGDMTRLRAVKGVGKKTAERMVVELKDRVATYALERNESRLRIETVVQSPLEEACQALEALGFARRAAEEAVKQVSSKGVPADSDSAWIVREALRFV